MSGHVHAHLMALYAQDAAETDKPWERWEILKNYDEWEGLSANPLWCDLNDYRRKPKTININGFEVPKPCRENLEIGQGYWLVDPANETCYPYYWENTICELLWLRAGLVHPTKEAAELHRKALLSFTEVKE